MQKVFLYGYWAHNLGDDLFLQIFMEHYPNTEICLVTESKYAKYYDNPRITCIYKDEFFYHVKNKLCKIFADKGAIFFSKEFKEADCAVILGGSLFMEYRNWEKYVAKVLRNYRECAPACYVVGSNFGPYQSKEFEEAFRAIFRQMDGVCLRDRYSAELFKDVQGVRYAPDIAFNLATMQPKLPQSPYRNYYVISVIEPERRIGLQGYGEIYEKAMLETACKLAESGAKIVFMSVCSDLDDDKMAERLLQKAMQHRIEAVHDSYDKLETSLAVLKGARGVVATHFHTMILSFVYDVPVFPVIYNIKMENVLADYGYHGESCRVQELEKWNTAQVVKALEKKPCISKEVFEMAGNIFNDTDVTLGKRQIESAFGEEGVAVCLYGDDAYTPYIGVAVSSIIENSSPEHRYDILVLGNGITKEHARELSSLSQGKAWVSVRVIDCEKELQKFRIMKDSCFTINIYLRFLVFTELFAAYDRILTLDSDLIVNGDLHRLYQWNLDGKRLAAVRDQYVHYIVERKCHGNKTINYQPMEVYFRELQVDIREYFNSGVLLFDLHKCRESNLWDEIEQVCKQHKALMYPDQDILNIIFKSDYVKLPMEWNGASPYGLIHGRAHVSYEELPEYYIEQVEKALVIHYTGGRKPWLDREALYTDRYMEYADGTMWKEIIREKQEQWEQRQRANAGKLMERLFPKESKRRKKAADVFYQMNDILHGWK